jgi:hypothetical protein
MDDVLHPTRDVIVGDRCGTLTTLTLAVLRMECLCEARKPYHKTNYTRRSGPRIVAGSLASGLKCDPESGDTSAMTDQPPQMLAVPLSWIGYEDVPILYANQVLIQFQPEGGFVLAIGQATPPPLIGTPEQIAEQAAEVEFVPVKTLARFGMTRAKLQEIITVLQVNLDSSDRLQSQIDPRN